MRASLFGWVILINSINGKHCMHIKRQWPHLCEFREFWLLFQRLWFFYHKSQRNLFLQRNPNMDLHIWATLPLFRQALGTSNNMTQVSGVKRGQEATHVTKLNLKDGCNGAHSPVAAAGQPVPPALLSVSVALSLESHTY